MYIVQFFTGASWSRLTASNSETAAIQAADRYASRYDSVRVVDEDGMVVYFA